LRDCGLTGLTVVVGDSNTIPLYGEIVQESLQKAGYMASIIMIEAGEENKTLETVANIWRGLLSAGMDRKGIVVALGGGVVGDLSGFAASTYMRGCRWVGVPTTLLSMVDASIGGKTGFDLPEGKNLIGSFHSPSMVIVDPQVLASLPVEEIKSGLAEVIKHGIIADPELFQLCNRGLDWLLENMVLIVRRAMGVKIRIIHEDPYEAGVRAALNLGHTIGHAIEIASHFRLRHGEAVAIGMVVEAGIALRLQLSTAGLVEKITRTLVNVGLPTSIPPNLNREVIISAMKLDKKKDKNTIKFALPVDIGSVQVGVAIEDLEGII
jgi:3-dehydroquinate synthase